MWIRNPGNQFNEAIKENLKDYLNPGDTALRDKRLQEFKNKLQEAIKMSQPLINVDNEILQRVHNIKKSELSRVVTDIPVRGDDDAENIVDSIFRDFDDNEWNFSDIDQTKAKLKYFPCLKKDMMQQYLVLYGNQFWINGEKKARNKEVFWEIFGTTEEPDPKTFYSNFKSASRDND